MYAEFSYEKTFVSSCARMNWSRVYVHFCCYCSQSIQHSKAQQSTIQHSIQQSEAQQNSCTFIIINKRLCWAQHTKDNIVDVEWHCYGCCCCCCCRSCCCCCRSCCCCWALELRELRRHCGTSIAYWKTGKTRSMKPKNIQSIVGFSLNNTHSTRYIPGRIHHILSSFHIRFVRLVPLVRSVSFWRSLFFGKKYFVYWFGKSGYEICRTHFNNKIMFWHKRHPFIVISNKSKKQNIQAK